MTMTPDRIAAIQALMTSEHRTHEQLDAVVEELLTDVTENAEAIRYTADVVCLREDGTVLLIERGWEPHKGQLALPGGHVDVGETALAAAVRELKEETGVGVDASQLTLIGHFDAPGRDPRGRYVTAAFLAVVPAYTEAEALSDAAAVRWESLDGPLDNLAFDHAAIVRAGLAARAADIEAAAARRYVLVVNQGDLVATRTGVMTPAPDARESDILADLYRDVTTTDPNLRGADIAFWKFGPAHL